MMHLGLNRTLPLTLNKRVRESEALTLPVKTLPCRREAIEPKNRLT
jgi:hypothetical protein